MQRSKPSIIVFIDTETMDVEHVYVGISRKEAINAFLRLMRGDIEEGYSDARDELTELLERYTMTELDPHQISIRRGL